MTRNVFCCCFFFSCKNHGKTLMNFDIQMWIYSLGVTLRRAIQLFSTGISQQSKATTVKSAMNTVASNGQKHKNLTSLEYVIRAMCAPNILYRASLMYLLDVSIMFCIALYSVIHTYFCFISFYLLCIFATIIWLFWFLYISYHKLLKQPKIKYIFSAFEGYMC